MPRLKRIGKKLLQLLTQKDCEWSGKGILQKANLAKAA